MTQVEKQGLLPNEVRALREATGLDEAQFGSLFGVSANVVARWEQIGVSTGPTAVALRYVGQDAGYPFSPVEGDFGTCTICGAAANDLTHGLPVCSSCHREPVAALEGLGFVITRRESHATRQEEIQLTFPTGAPTQLSGRFMSEGLGTMLAKLFKQEPQLGDETFDDAVYVQWVDDPDDALADEVLRHLLASLVAFGVVDIDTRGIDVQHVPNWFEGDVIFIAGLLAARVIALGADV